MAPDWLPEYQTEWRTFLGRDVGFALMERLRAIEAHVAISACSNPLHTIHAAGVANGWTECRQWLDSLSRSSARNQDGPTEGAEQSGHDEQPPGEAELLERLSP